MTRSTFIKSLDDLEAKTEEWIAEGLRLAIVFCLCTLAYITFFVFVGYAFLLPGAFLTALMTSAVIRRRTAAIDELDRYRALRSPESAA